MKGIIRFIVLAAVVMITAFAFHETTPLNFAETPLQEQSIGFNKGELYGRHFESRCDTLTRGTDTIVNCYVRCSNPPLAKDTIPPRGEYKYIEATVTWTASIDTVKFQLLNPITNTWSDIGVWDLTAADNPYMVSCYNAGVETRRFRIGIPYPLRVRAILTSPASYSVRSLQVVWEGSGE